MNLRRTTTIADRATLTLWSIAVSFALISPSLAQTFEIKPVAEKKIDRLPAGQLFWRIDNFATLAEARAAEGPTGIAAEVAGQVWLFALGSKGQSSPGGTKVDEIGPVPIVNAEQFILRINNTGGPPGAKTPVHTHPGSETFYVLTGQLSQRSPHGISRVDLGNLCLVMDQGCRWKCPAAERLT